MSRRKRTRALLLAAFFVLSVCIAMTLRTKQTVPTPYYDTQLAAAAQLEQCFQAVRGYKEARAIPLAPEDVHQTGLIGAEYTLITTTIGALEAKRTTASPDMGALCVRLLYEAGVRAGDTVGAGMSGSFPALNLALICACESMGVQLICIPSIGASTYGANQPELTFPEMMWQLQRDGIIATKAQFVTVGGDYDVGAGMDETLLKQVKNSLAQKGLTLVEQPDFQANLRMREAIYRENNIVCFVAVGGNVTSLGRGESGISLGQGVLSAAHAPKLDEDSGLVQRYLAQGMSVIHLLNIKKLVAEYGMPYDPPVFGAAGESAVYYHTTYAKAWLLVALTFSALALASCKVFAILHAKQNMIT